METPIRMMDVSGVAARLRPFGHLNAQNAYPGAGILASTVFQRVNDVRSAAVCGDDAWLTSRPVMKPTVLTAQERAEARRASGPYPWRPPED